MSANPFEKAAVEIERYFDNIPEKTFKSRGLEMILNDNRHAWSLSDSRRAAHFIAFLIQKKWLLEWDFFTSPGNTATRIYSWKTKHDLTIMSGLKRQAYFSHYSALFLNNLTEQIPKTYYLNREHSGHVARPEEQLRQEAIDRAFAKEQRKAGKQYAFNQFKIILLNGQYTDRLGVTEVHDKNEKYAFTNLPRTLIDCAIRPAYAGGIFEVMKAFKNASDDLDVKLLKHYLDQLDFIYPYKQLIGFYLERTGYPPKQLKYFEGPAHLNFYLTYNMRNPDYDPRWKIYFPKGMDAMYR